MENTTSQEKIISTTVERAMSSGEDTSDSESDRKTNRVNSVSPEITSNLRIIPYEGATQQNVQCQLDNQEVKIVLNLKIVLMCWFFSPYLLPVN